MKRRHVILAPGRFMEDAFLGVEPFYIHKYVHPLSIKPRIVRRMRWRAAIGNADAFRRWSGRVGSSVFHDVLGAITGVVVIRKPIVVDAESWIVLVVAGCSDQDGQTGQNES